jgi:hypothetical protein
MSKTETTKKKEKAPSVEGVSLKYYMLQPIVQFLNIPLHSEKAIARNRIVKLISEKHEELEAVRMDLIKEHAEKDADGSPKMSEDKSHYIMKDDAAFDAEWQVLKNQEVVFDLLPSNRNYWRVAREIIKYTKEQMTYEKTEIWEAIVEALATV